jgi:hypothetical protein
VCWVDIIPRFQDHHVINGYFRNGFYRFSIAIDTRLTTEHVVCADQVLFPRPEVTTRVEKKQKTIIEHIAIVADIHFGMDCLEIVHELSWG